MAAVKWIKLNIDMFDHRKIKHLRHLPDGNNIVLIWVMLLTMAGRCNANGMIFLTENIPYTTKMLADELGFEENTVKLALEALEQFEMIVMNGNHFAIAGWQEYQNIEGMDKIREQNRLRKQKQREKKSLPFDASRDSHVTVTQGHATDIERELEEDLDIKNQSINQEEEPKKKTIDRLIDNLTFSDIRNQIEYDILCTRIDRDELDLAVRIIAEMYVTTEPLTINGFTYSAEFVQKRSLSITSSHIEYVFECFGKQRETVHNVKNYLFVAIFNKVVSSKSKQGCAYIVK